MELAERLKLVRDSLGKSQKDMALLINSSLSALQSYESGRQFPGGKVFEALARMGFDSNWLLTGEGTMHRPKANGHVANGNNIIQGAHIDAEDVHLTVHQVKEAQAKYEIFGVKADGVKHKQIDPLIAAFIKDWMSLSDVGRMRVWTFLKEEFSKENPEVKVKIPVSDDIEEWDWENL